MLTQEEIIKVFTEFLDETGHFYAFKEFIEKVGYTLEEFGIKE